MTTANGVRYHGYWQAHGLVEHELSRFTSAVQKKNRRRQRSAFYRLASYYGRTLHILNSALESNNEMLVQASLHNFLTLHRALTHMHRADPEMIPMPLPLDESDRREFLSELVMRVLRETPPALTTAVITERVNHLDMLGNIGEEDVRGHLSSLVEAGHAVKEAGQFAKGSRPYVELDMGLLSLRALCDPNLYQRVAGAGYSGLRDIADQEHPFQTQFLELTGLEQPESAHLFTEAVEMLLKTTSGEASVWSYADILHSQYPRPYQRQAYDAFSRGDYRSQVIEAPTGSGKTMIGMMCIQDFLRSLQVGQSILILVPTSNYQQQWLGELCYHDIGLQLTPEIIFSGTPAQLERYQKHTGSLPAVIVLTYTALAQIGSGTGKGGFDVDSIEIFLQGANVKYVILDEVHKVVEDMHSVSTQVVRVLIDWQKDTSLRGLIGFTGTAEAYRSHFDELGLSLDYSVPIEDLVAAGFVAPFAEIGVPFAFSARERRIRELLDEYKDGMRAYYRLLGPDKLRRWFGELPLEHRLFLGHDMLGMYHGRRDWEQAMVGRFKKWEDGRMDELSITEIRLVDILQIAHAWSDVQMADQAGVSEEDFSHIVKDLKRIKGELVGLIHQPRTLQRLQVPGYSEALDVPALNQIVEGDLPAAARPDAVKDVLATTITGLYAGLSGWYLRVGEGRVEVIKAIINAGRATRPISGIIVFDTGRRIHWRKGVDAPGYRGVAGLFAEMIGSPDFTALAVLSSEIYLSKDSEGMLPEQIAAYIEDSIMQGEAVEAIIGYATQGLELTTETLSTLDAEFHYLVKNYIPRLRNIHASRPGEFDRRVIRPVIRNIKKMNLGLAGERLMARLDRHNFFSAGLIHTFFEYALIARYFRQAKTAQLEQVSGAQQEFYVIPMPGSAHRKQLMYDLTSRIVDEETLPINLVIVSNWARTGWNVIKPNVLIDATATRNVTAWQQLRGRAIRALRTWDNDCYRLLTVVTGDHHSVTEHLTEVEAGAGGMTGYHIDEELAALLDEITPPGFHEEYPGLLLPELPEEARFQLAVELLRQRNKVTHIYELVKASGSTNQVTFNRQERSWMRKDAIAEKHAVEISVNPITGVESTGVEHAPFIYAKDPRKDLPSQLQGHITDELKGKDAVIVYGWVRRERGTRGSEEEAQ